jgi:hypothetical protein
MNINDEIQSHLYNLLDDKCSADVISTELEATYSQYQLHVWYTGGFDSPGYEISCYAVSWIDDQNQLNISEFTIEDH